jgi:hypothetical protein
MAEAIPNKGRRGRPASDQDALHFFNDSVVDINYSQHN